MITYRTGNDLDLEEVIAVYRDCTLGGRRPVDEPDRMAAMLRNANLVITAWDGNQLVGIARALSDFAYTTYLADLAVRDSHQKQGIGRALIEQVRQQGGPHTRIVLLAAPQAVDYYPHIGFTRHPSAWTLP